MKNDFQRLEMESISRYRQKIQHNLSKQQENFQRQKELICEFNNYSSNPMPIKTTVDNNASSANYTVREEENSLEYEFAFQLDAERKENKANHQKWEARQEKLTLDLAAEREKTNLLKQEVLNLKRNLKGKKSALKVEELEKEKSKLLQQMQILEKEVKSWKTRSVSGTNLASRRHTAEKEVWRCSVNYQLEVWMIHMYKLLLSYKDAASTGKLRTINSDSIPYPLGNELHGFKVSELQDDEYLKSLTAKLKSFQSTVDKVLKKMKLVYGQKSKKQQELFDAEKQNLIEGAKIHREALVNEMQDRREKLHLAQSSDRISWSKKDEEMKSKITMLNEQIREYQNANSYLLEKFPDIVPDAIHHCPASAEKLRQFSELFKRNFELKLKSEIEAQHAASLQASSVLEEDFNKKVAMLKVKQETKVRELATRNEQVQASLVDQNSQLQQARKKLESITKLYTALESKSEMEAEKANKKEFLLQHFITILVSSFIPAIVLQRQMLCFQKAYIMQENKILQLSYEKIVQDIESVCIVENPPPKRCRSRLRRAFISAIVCVRLKRLCKLKYIRESSRINLKEYNVNELKSMVTNTEILLQHIFNECQNATFCSWKTSSESWNRVVSTQTAFRTYLEHLADSFNTTNNQKENLMDQIAQYEIVLEEKDSEIKMNMQSMNAEFEFKLEKQRQQSISKEENISKLQFENRQIELECKKNEEVAKSAQEQVDTLLLQKNILQETIHEKCSLLKQAEVSIDEYNTKQESYQTKCAEQLHVISHLHTSMDELSSRLSALQHENDVKEFAHVAIQTEKVRASQTVATSVKQGTVEHELMHRTLHQLQEVVALRMAKEEQLTLDKSMIRANKTQVKLNGSKCKSEEVVKSEYLLELDQKLLSFYDSSPPSTMTLLRSRTATL